MKISKSWVLDLVDKMPGDPDADELKYQLYVLRKIAEGEADIAAGRTIPHEEVEREISEWLK